MNEKEIDMLFDKLDSYSLFQIVELGTFDDLTVLFSVVITRAKLKNYFELHLKEWLNLAEHEIKRKDVLKLRKDMYHVVRLALGDEESIRRKENTKKKGGFLSWFR